MIELAICLSLVQATSNGSVLPQTEARRYASDIAAVAKTPEEAAILVTVANHEGSFRRDVETCKVTGDVGAAFSLYQLHRHWFAGDPRRLCESNREATDTAGRVLRFLRKRTDNLTEMFRAYIGCKAEDTRIVKRLATLSKLMEIAGHARIQ
jgi:hypothetical protein